MWNKVSYGVLPSSETSPPLHSVISSFFSLPSSVKGVYVGSWIIQNNVPAAQVKTLPAMRVTVLKYTCQMLQYDNAKRYGATLTRPQFSTRHSTLLMLMSRCFQHYRPANSGPGAAPPPYPGRGGSGGGGQSSSGGPGHGYGEGRGHYNRADHQQQPQPPPLQQQQPSSSRGGQGGSRGGDRRSGAYRASRIEMQPMR